MQRHHHIFASIIAAAKRFDPIALAVVYPLSEVSLRGAVEAAVQGLVTPTLIGPVEQMTAFASDHGIDISSCATAEADTEEAAASLGVEMCRTGKAEALMKGSLHTDHLMHAVMQEATGLRTHRRLSHVFIFDVPEYPRMLLISDAAINIYPTLTDKVDIVQNAIDLAHGLGVSDPKVAILSAVETVTPALHATIDAAALCKMAERGQITGATLDGPLAFDNAVNLRAAEIKHIQSPVAGNADILIVPDLEAGNMLAKQLEYFAEADAAGIVMGARVPIILTSRADSAKTRLASCAVAVVVAHARRQAATGQPVPTGVHHE
ncbi:Phosphate acetyltransferase [Roseovarius litorisediminis]|uniref:Phosphate acetyltransferase n=1 Tax=Roseovarius litorisediminis TaxID=1312363 RepID=A0A1Y5S6F1_9RHOB|nr:bifunctional enoyl-CoA hydratase/phosphate acetyltransferase [Roseovarius litorisediminis]SLN31177.1 Phosphate acetyltransferase [Roseovarius litorisediminis]